MVGALSFQQNLTLKIIQVRWRNCKQLVSAGISGALRKPMCREHEGCQALVQEAGLTLTWVLAPLPPSALQVLARRRAVGCEEKRQGLLLCLSRPSAPQRIAFNLGCVALCTGALHCQAQSFARSSGGPRLQATAECACGCVRSCITGGLADLAKLAERLWGKSSAGARKATNESKLSVRALAWVSEAETCRCTVRRVAKGHALAGLRHPQCRCE